MAFPILDIIGLLQDWQKYIILILIVAADTIATGYVNIFNYGFAGFFTTPINLVGNYVFNVPAFHMTSFQLLIIVVLFPIIVFMLKMALSQQ